MMAAIAEWRRRSAELSTRLRTSAAGPDAWLFRIHLRIIRFLLVRYDLNPAEPIESANAARAEPAQPAAIGPLEPPEGRRPRSREEIRAVLIRIAVANKSGGSGARPLLRAA